MRGSNLPLKGDCKIENGELWVWLGEWRWWDEWEKVVWEVKVKDGIIKAKNIE